MLERTNARSLAPGDLRVRTRPRRGRRLLHLADQGAAGRARVLRGALRRAGDGQAAVRGRARARGEGRRRARARGAPRRRSSRWRRAPALTAPRCSASPRRACRGPRAIARRSSGWRRPARAAVRGRPRGAGPRGRAMTVRTRTATVLSHARPAQTAEALRALIEAAEREGVLLRFDAEETRKYGLTPRDGPRARRAAQRRRRAVRVARRRRHHPARAAPLRGHERARLRRQLRRGRLPRHHRPRRGRRPARRLRAGAGRRLRGADPAGARAGDARGPAGGDQRCRDPPPRRRARRGARLRHRRRGGRLGALRRPRALDAGRLDGLQPRQRRAGAGLGRGGLRGVVHRAALADRAGARGRPERPAVGPQPLAGRGRHLARRAPGRPARPGRRHQRVASCARRPIWPRSPGSSFYRRLRQKFGRLAS